MVERPSVWPPLRTAWAIQSSKLETLMPRSITPATPSSWRTPQNFSVGLTRWTITSEPGRIILRAPPRKAPAAPRPRSWDGRTAPSSLPPREWARDGAPDSPPRADGHRRRGHRRCQGRGGGFRAPSSPGTWRSESPRTWAPAARCATRRRGSAPRAPPRAAPPRWPRHGAPSPPRAPWPRRSSAPRSPRDRSCRSCHPLLGRSGGTLLGGQLDLFAGILAGILQNPGEQPVRHLVGVDLPLVPALDLAVHAQHPVRGGHHPLLEDRLHPQPQVGAAAAVDLAAGHHVAPVPLDLGQELVHPLVAGRHGLHDGRQPVAVLADRQHHLEVLGRLLHPVAVGLVDHEDVGDLQDSRLDGLDVVPQAGDGHHHDGVHRAHHVHLVLPHAHRLDEDPVEAGRVEQIDGVAGGAGQPAHGAAGGHRADEDAGIGVEGRHADTVAQQGAAGERAGGIDGQDAHRLPALADAAGETVHERALAGAGGTGDADHPRFSRLAVDPPDQLPLPRPAVLQDRDRPSESARVALEQARNEVVEGAPHLPGPPLPALRPPFRGEEGERPETKTENSLLEPPLSPAGWAEGWERGGWGSEGPITPPSEAAARSPAAGSRWCPRRWCRSWRRGSTSRPGNP